MARAAELAVLFFQELLDSCETLNGLVDIYGPETGVELLYLQNAIYMNQTVDISHDSNLHKVLKGMKSQEVWTTYTCVI